MIWFRKKRLPKPSLEAVKAVEEAQQNRQTAKKLIAKSEYERNKIIVRMDKNHFAEGLYEAITPQHKGIQF